MTGGGSSSSRKSTNISSSSSSSTINSVYNNPPKTTGASSSAAIDKIKAVGYGIGSFGYGIGAGVGESLSAGTSRVLDPGFRNNVTNQGAYLAGKVVGNVAAGAGGVVMAGGGAVGGVVTSPTGVGAVAGTSVAVAGGAIAVSGGVNAVQNAKDLGTYIRDNKGSSVGSESTGRTTPNNLNEQLAMDQVKSNPMDGAKQVPIKLNDSRWPSSDGWVKMENAVKTSNGNVTVHFNYNTKTGAFADFKFK